MQNWRLMTSDSSWNVLCKSEPEAVNNNPTIWILHSTHAPVAADTLKLWTTKKFVTCKLNQIFMTRPKHFARQLLRLQPILEYLRSTVTTRPTTTIYVYRYSVSVDCLCERFGLDEVHLVWRASLAQRLLPVLQMCSVSGRTWLPRLWTRCPVSRLRTRVVQSATFVILS